MRGPTETSSASITCQLVRNADSQALPQTCRLRNPRGRAQQSGFERVLHMWPLHTTVQDPLSYQRSARGGRFQSRNNRCLFCSVAESPAIISRPAPQLEFNKSFFDCLTSFKYQPLYSPDKKFTKRFLFSSQKDCPYKTATRAPKRKRRQRLRIPGGQWKTFHRDRNCQPLRSTLPS